MGFVYTLVPPTQRQSVPSFISIEPGEPQIKLAYPNQQNPGVYSFQISVKTDWYPDAVVSEDY
jgi:hypothetical protein